MAVNIISAPALANAVCASSNREGLVRRRSEDQSGVESLKVQPYWSASVVPRPPSRSRTGGRDVVGLVMMCGIEEVSKCETFGWCYVVDEGDEGQG